MPTANEIEVTFPAAALRNADTAVVVKAAGRKLGSLRISQNEILWAPATRRDSVTLTWKQFAELMAESGRPAPAATTRAPKQRQRRASKPSTSTRSRLTTKPQRRRGGTPVTPAAVRSWANENGIAVNSRGRISAGVMDAYRAAH